MGKIFLTVNLLVAVFWSSQVVADVRADLEQTSLRYFLENANPKTGLVRDTASNTEAPNGGDGRASIAATGFGLAVIVNAGERGLIPRADAQAYALRILSFVQDHLEERKGWLYHFIDWETGKRWEKSEYSTIDTAFLIAGALYAAELYPGSDVARIANELYERLDFEDMRTEGGAFPEKFILTSSFRPEKGYSQFRWKDYAEATLLYILGLGHPTHPLPAASWTAWTRESLKQPSGEILVGFDKPLFTHQYSQLFIDFQGRRDNGVDYFENARLNTLYNKSISDNHPEFLTFRDGFWGLSAGDSSTGYLAYSPKRFDGTVCMGCTMASAMYLPHLIFETARKWKDGEFGPRIWGRYGFADSLNLEQDWVSNKVHGITVGPIFLALANLHPNTSLWSVFDRIPAIRRGLKRAGLARQVTALDQNWKFTIGGKVNSVNLPHTWNNEDATSPHYFRGAGEYQKSLPLFISPGEELFLRVGAANEVADVFVNETKVGSHRGGYTAFAFNITKSIKNGELNSIRIVVDNSSHADVAPIEADFTFFGGLYRGVSLIRTASQHVSVTDFASPGIYLTPSEISDEGAKVQVRSVVTNDAAYPSSVTVVATIRDEQGKQIAQSKNNINVAPQTDETSLQAVVVEHPHLWEGTRSPYLYAVVVQVLDNEGNLLDAVEQKLGIRTLSIDGSGVTLNGRRTELNGVALHQDWDKKGWAIGEREREINLRFIKDVGANAVRLAHYPRAEEELGGLDRAGILAWSEIPLVNVVNPTDSFALSTKTQLREMIHQLYNHPAIFAWGIYNEIKSDPNQLVAELNRLAHETDPSRPTTAATDRTVDDSFNRVTDLLAFNRYDGWYKGQWTDFGNFIDAQKSKMGNRAIGVSEYGAGASVNDHEDPPRQPILGGKFHPEEWQNEFHEAYFRQLEARPSLFGHFEWNLFDFAAPHRREGEVPGMNDKGLVTYDRRIKKDAYYFYRAHWNPEPTLYLTGRRFGVRRSATANVKVYSNLERVTLTWNGTVIGTMASDGSKVFQWKNVPLNKGINRFEVSGNVSGQVISDEATWTRE